MVPVTAKVINLPDGCLLALFKNLPLNDQLTARKVCRRWASLLPEITKKRTHLSILVSYLSMDTFAEMARSRSTSSSHGHMIIRRPLFFKQTKWNTVQFSTLDGNAAVVFVEDLLSCFEDIKSLQITTSGGVRDLEPFIELLTAWRNSLHTFKYFDALYHANPVPSSEAFFDALNNLLFLTSLTLHLTTLKIHDLSVVSYLQELSIYSPSTPVERFVELIKCPAEINVRQGLAIYYRGTSSGSSGGLGALTKLKDTVRDRFRQIAFFDSDGFMVPHSVLPVCNLFHSLTSINIAPTGITYYQLYSHLAKLTKLTHLRLLIDFRKMLNDEDDDQKPPQSQSQQKPQKSKGSNKNTDSTTRPLPPPLPNVRSLFLELHGMRTHQKIEQLQLGRTMANLKILEIDFKRSCRCTICGVRSFELTQLRADAAAADAAADAEVNPVSPPRRCLIQAFVIVKKHCPQLVAIWDNFQETFYTSPHLLNNGANDRTLNRA